MKISQKVLGGATFFDSHCTFQLYSALITTPMISLPNFSTIAEILNWWFNNFSRPVFGEVCSLYFLQLSEPNYTKFGEET